MGNNHSKKPSKTSKPIPKQKQEMSNIESYLSPTGRISRISNELLRRKFSQIENYSLKASFDNLSTMNERGIAHINKGAFIGYLGFPDDVGAGPLIYRSFTYLANYPSVGHTDALLTYDGLIKAVAIYCDMAKDVINENRVKLLFDSFSTSENEIGNGQRDRSLKRSESSISQIPQLVTPEDTEFLKAIGFYESNPSKISKVRNQDMVKLLTGLIWLMSSEMSSINANSEALKQNLKKIISPEFINRIQEDAVHFVEHMAQYDNNKSVESDQVITWLTFNNFIERNAPNIFRAFIPFIYGQFLIGLTLSQQRNHSFFQGPEVQYWPKLDSHSDILNQMNMGLLSWMLPENVVKRHHWNCLYSSSKHGFSMNRFHRSVFKYPGPTLLLIHADRDIIDIPRRRESITSTSPGAGKNEVLTSKSKKHVNTLLLGAYVADPWKSTSNPKTCFGSEECALFEVLPVFEKFPATKFNSNYVYYNPSFGIGFGGIATSSITSNVITTSDQNSFALQIDNTLQFGRYRNDAGVYHEIKPTYRLSATRQFIDIPFEVIEIEVFGLGGDLAKEKQEKEWEWEEAEAAKRRGYKKSGKEDKEILKLAGIIDEDSRNEIQTREY